jgi:hypothetical protein
VLRARVVLAVVVAATACAEHDEATEQAQWAADAPRWVLTALGAKPDPLTGEITAPSESTLRRTLAGRRCRQSATTDRQLGPGSA